MHRSTRPARRLRNATLPSPQPAIERLEHRFLLCSTAAELIAAGIPASVIGDDGHIRHADYAALTAQQQAHVNPHLISDPRGEAVMDFDALLGLPLHATRGGAPDAEDALPDFYPVANDLHLDTFAQPGRNLLRFGTQINNQGTGPGTLLSGRGNTNGTNLDPIPTGAPITRWVNPDGSQNVLQAVYSYDGARFALSHYRAAGTFTWHPQHAHFHYDGYANYKLRHRNTDGTPGAYVQRNDGTGVVGAKTGFCLINIYNSFTLPNGTSSTTLPGYGKPGQPNTGCGLLQGISVGMADEYWSNLEGQWLDVTGVPNGNYFLEVALDGEDAVLELDESNNVGTFAYTINANPPTGGITPDVFDTNANNNTFEAATDMGVLGTLTRAGLNIHWGQDEDYFKFVASSGGSATVRVTPSQGNTDLYLYDAGRALVASSTADGGVADAVTYNFVAGQTYFAKVNAYNSTTSSGYQLQWTLKPAVSNTVGQPVAREFDGAAATFVIARNGPANTPLTVNFTLGGTATNGVDYEVVASSVTIGNLESTATVRIVPLGDGLLEPTETVTLTLNSDAAYVIGGTAAQSVSIADTGPQVSQPLHAWQTAPNRLAFAFTLDVGASFGADDLVIRNRDTGATVMPASVTYDAASKTATATFAGVLGDGRYRATLSAAGITHELGAPMPADYVYDFFQLAGDADHDGAVNLADFNVLAANFGQSGRDASTGDFTYDGQVNLDDFNVLAAKFGTAIAVAAAPEGSAFGSRAKSIGGEDDEQGALEGLV